MKTPNKRTKKDSNKVVIQKGITNKQAELEKEIIKRIIRKLELRKEDNFSLGSIKEALKIGIKVGKEIGNKTLQEILK